MSKKTKIIQTEKNYEWEASENGQNVDFVIEDVRFAFTRNGESLFTPEEYMNSSKFKGQFIIEDEDGIEQMKEIIQFLMVNNVDSDFEIGDDFDTEIPGIKHSFLRNGDNNTNKDGEIYSGFADKYYIAANRSEKQGAPAVFDQSGDLIKDLDERVFKDGCRGNLAGRAYYSSEWTMLGCTLEAVIYTDEGEPFAGDSSFANNEDKKKKLLGRFKPKKNKLDQAFKTKKKKSEG